MTGAVAGDVSVGMTVGVAKQVVATADCGEPMRP